MSKTHELEYEQKKMREHFWRGIKIYFIPESQFNKNVYFMKIFIVKII